MHFPRIDYIDWCKHLGATAVVVVVDDQVIRELDDLKDGGKGQGRKDKARSVLKFLSPLLEEDTPPEVRPNVTVASRTESVAIDFDRARLDPKKQDDHFLAGVLSFKLEHPEADIVVVADDSNVRIKAKKHGLKAVDPTTFVQRQELQSAEEKELAQLRRTVAEMQGRVPKLEFGLRQRGELVRHLALLADEPTAQELSEDELARIVAVERARRTEDFWGNPLYSRSDLRDYFERVDRYLEDFADHLWFDNMLSSGFDVVVSFGMRNAGAAAHRVSVDIVVADALLVELLEDKEYILKEEGERPDPPAAPEPAAPFGNPLAGMFTGPTFVPYFPGIPAEGRPEPDVERIFTEGKTVTWYLPALRSGESARSARIWMILPASCAAGYSMTAQILSTEAPRLDVSLQVSFEPSREGGEGVPEPPSREGES